MSQGEKNYGEHQELVSQQRYTEDMFLLRIAYKTAK
jgi:hypothetical protein